MKKIRELLEYSNILLFLFIIIKIIDFHNLSVLDIVIIVLALINLILLLVSAIFEKGEN